jgi:predicted transcriptional regulator
MSSASITVRMDENLNLLDISRMSKAEFDAMVQEGMDDIKAGRCTPIEQVWEEMGLTMEMEENARESA